MSNKTSASASMPRVPWKHAGAICGRKTAMVIDMLRHVDAHDDDDDGGDDRQP